MSFFLCHLAIPSFTAICGLIMIVASLFSVAGRTFSFFFFFLSLLLSSKSLNGKNEFFPFSQRVPSFFPESASSPFSAAFDLPRPIQASPISPADGHNDFFSSPSLCEFARRPY